MLKCKNGDSPVALVAESRTRNRTYIHTHAHQREIKSKVW